MEDLLIETLSKFGYDVKQQGSIAEDEDYPEHFFTFWQNVSEGAGHYDNKETAETGDFDVNFYSTDPAKPYEMLKKAKQELKRAGFIVSGTGHTVASDQPSHTGRGINVKYYKQLKEEED